MCLYREREPGWYRWDRSLSSRPAYEMALDGRVAAKWIDGTDEGTAFVYQQSTVASTWTINHNLGHVPSVEVFDSGSQEIEADVSHPSVNTTIIVFTVPTAGFARLI